MPDAYPEKQAKCSHLMQHARNAFTDGQSLPIGSVVYFTRGWDHDKNILTAIDISGVYEENHTRGDSLL